MKRIVVTGGHGMLGRYVVAALEPDYEVTVVDRVDGGSHQPHGPVDVMDLGALERAVQGHEAIVHLAALDAAVDAPAHDFFHVNTIASWNTLHVGYEAGIRRFVVCSSSSVYGVRETTPLYLPIDESHPSRATAPYGLSKRATELVASGFALRDNVVAVALRPCYVAYSHLIDRMSREVETVEPGEEPLPPLRWHVSPRDAARCFRAALEADISGYQVFNVGGPDSFSSRPSLAVAESEYGTLPEIRDPAWFDADPRASLVDCTRARAVLGWSPRDDWASHASRHGS